MKKRLLCMCAIATFLIGGLAITQVEARDSYPKKRIDYICPFPAGSGFDMPSRIIARALEQDFGVPVIVKNMPGAGGRRGATAIFKSPNDGYTIGLVHWPPFLEDEIFYNRKPPVEYHKFEIIIQYAMSHHFVIVKADSPWNTLRDLKKTNRPLKVSEAGSMNRISASALSQLVGFPMTFVSGYKKIADAVIAVVKGEVDFTTGGPMQIGDLAKEGDVRLLAYLAPDRSLNYPDVPTIAELGFPILGNLGIPHTIVGPPGFPKSAAKVIREAVIRLTRTREFKDWTFNSGLFIRDGDTVAILGWEENNRKIYTDVKPIVAR